MPKVANKEEASDTDEALSGLTRGGYRIGRPAQSILVRVSEASELPQRRAPVNTCRSSSITYRELRPLGTSEAG